MFPPRLNLVAPPERRAAALPSLAQALRERAGVDQRALFDAKRATQRHEVSLAEVLTCNGVVSPKAAVNAEADRADCAIINPVAELPDARLIDSYGVQAALRDGVLPWRHIGGATVILAASAHSFYAAKTRLENRFGRVQLAFATDDTMTAALLGQRRRQLADAADVRVAAEESCRTIGAGRSRLYLAAAILPVGAALFWQPLWVFAALAGWATLTLVLIMCLRAAAGFAQITRPGGRKTTFVSQRNRVSNARLPQVSLLVPLLREHDIAGRLLKRLEALDYPRELLDVCLIAEQHDTITRATIQAAGLPPWMRLITVPPGAIQTKPRALNYALDFARGSIIGVYDAEDAPDPSQIAEVVEAFHRFGPEVACLQGVLDFYNPRQNWLARCFTVDYATWFRILLPGLSRMGLVVPLGGTTLFFRREVLERLGGWDAHNVTEDADLGVRLARRGFRTELIPTTTSEEANCHLWPWIRQRSRWLKGYAATYAVHMRSPRRLLSDLGLWKFLGFQILFLGTLSQFVLAPVLWTFWLAVLGLPHPVADLLPQALVITVAAAFLLSEVVNITLGIIAVSGPTHRWLIPWVPTLHAYWPLGAVAAYKALWELVSRPFFWDKTAHGLSQPDPAPSSASL